MLILSYFIHLPTPLLKWIDYRQCLGHKDHHHHHQHNHVYVDKRIMIFVFHRPRQIFHYVYKQKMNMNVSIWMIDEIIDVIGKTKYIQMVKLWMFFSHFTIRLQALIDWPIDFLLDQRKHYPYPCTMNWNELEIMTKKTVTFYKRFVNWYSYCLWIKLLGPL